MHFRVIIYTFGTFDERTWYRVAHRLIAEMQYVMIYRMLMIDSNFQYYMNAIHIQPLFEYIFQ